MKKQTLFRHFQIPSHLSWGKVKQPELLFKMTKPNKEDFIKDAIELVTNTLTSGGSYEMKYADHPVAYRKGERHKLEISLSNALECGDDILDSFNCSIFYASITMVISNPKKNNAEWLQDIFVGAMAAQIALDEWLAYDHDYAMSEL